MKKSEFSVAICVYGKDNHEHFKAAIESIVCQTVKPLQIVIVVDGPVPERLEEVIKVYEKESLFDVIRLSENQGHGNARRIALEHCRYELVALMDADDISVKKRFEIQLQCFAEDSTLSVVGGNIQEFLEEPDNVVACRRVPEYDELIKEYMKRRCPMNQMTVMFRKKDVIEAGGYLDWYCNEDYYLWIRMALCDMKFYNIQDILVKARVGSDMYQRRGGWKYFCSEAKLQKYMRKKNIISVMRYFYNCIIRFIVQIVFPNSIRGWFFKRFAREKVIQ